MDRVAEQIRELAPALAFLLAGVPLATLLDRLGFFGAATEVIVRRSPRGVPVVALWWLAAVTTVVLNLDTTIVLLTPLYLGLARRTGADDVSPALVPLLLAGLASSVLPVSNLTTLIAAEHYDLGTMDVVGRLAAPSVVAVIVGWLAYRRRHAVRLPAVAAAPVDHRALRLGGAVIVAVLVGFVVGPWVGLAPWMVVVIADVVLVALTRHLPWRDLPVSTAALVVAIAVVVAVLVPERLASDLAAADSVAALPALAIGGAAASGLVNNLPALLISLGPGPPIGWAGWAWLLGVNAGAVMLPLGALANLLWLRIMRAEGAPIRWRQYPALVIPVALPAFAAAVAVLVVERLLVGP